jgi:hypothetical protein
MHRSQAQEPTSAGAPEVGCGPTAPSLDVAANHITTSVDAIGSICRTRSTPPMLIIVVSAGAGPYSLDALILTLVNRHVT